ncbi:hypothetical protein DFH11DRAFT_1580991 [Phellopilus nigrolimitatus]|nr:hypothetical protein DFH11DRAFT_1580991 [Phellopilus nigrolimitatus]
MSCEASDFRVSQDQLTPPEPAMPSSSRASSFNLEGIRLANGSSEHLTEPPPLSSSSSQTSLLLLARCVGEVQPQTDAVSDGSGASTPEVDAQILEALRSKDRLFVLKLGEQMEALIRERHSRSKISLSPENQYQRLLVHRCAAYYKLSPENEPTTRDKSSIRDMAVVITIESRIPLRRISELVPAEQAQHPTFKIMRRSDQDRRRQKSSISRPGSIAGEDGELSDPEPSESGSMGSRSTTSRKHMTIAEREAAYQVARSRIFMDFEEKEKAKERDTSASSSTFSLMSASGSGSQSGGAGDSSVSDIDDNASTAPTESEWSIPVTDRRRGGDSGMNSEDSTRSYHPGSSAFKGPGGGSGRASGTASPAFTYPSLYDPSAHAPTYDPAYMPPPSGYMAAPYPMYAYPPHAAGQVPAPGQSYLAPYQYFPHYPYPGPPHQHPHPSSDPASPVAGPVDGYPQHAAAVPYMGPNPYGWGVPPPPTTPQHHHPPTENHSPPVPGQHQVLTSPVQYPHQYAPYMSPPGAVPYSSYPPYFQPPPQSHPPVMHPHSQPIYPVELPPTNGNPPDQSATSGLSNGNGGPPLSRQGNISGAGNGQHYVSNGGSANKHGPPPSARGAWSYGPGVGLHANVSGQGMHYGPGGGGESIGPRLSSNMRRTSGASSGSGGNRTPGDETASTASSSASSSSSRRTYMSTPSQHPLPARPDWAAGLKAQPTLHPARNRHESNSNSRNMSPARPPGGQQQNHHPSQHHASQQRTPIFLQPTDFPPLSSISSPTSDKRPAASGAWSNPGPATRTILSPNPGHTNHAQANTYANALFSHNMANGVTGRLEEDERGFERPPPKTSAELFNPKGGAKRTAQPQAQAQARFPSHDKAEKEKIETDRTRGEIIANAILVERVGSLKLQDQAGGNEGEGVSRADSAVTGLPCESPHSVSKITTAGA